MDFANKNQANFCLFLTQAFFFSSFFSYICFPTGGTCVGFDLQLFAEQLQKFYTLPPKHCLLRGRQRKQKEQGWLSFQKLSAMSSLNIHSCIKSKINITNLEPCNESVVLNESSFQTARMTHILPKLYRMLNILHFDARHLLPAHSCWVSSLLGILCTEVQVKQ